VFNKSNYYREFEANGKGNYFNRERMNQIVTGKLMIINFYYLFFIYESFLLPQFF